MISGETVKGNYKGTKSGQRRKKLHWNLGGFSSEFFKLSKDVSIYYILGPCFPVANQIIWSVPMDWEDTTPLSFAL